MAFIIKLIQVCCDWAECGAFLGIVASEPNGIGCAVQKILPGGAVEYNMSLPSDLCDDQESGRECYAVTAQDRGTPWFGGTGHGSFLFYTSGICTCTRVCFPPLPSVV